MMHLNKNLMKYINIFAAGILLSFAKITYGQDLIGVGDFKVGMSIEEFLSVPDIAQLKIKENERGLYDLDSKTLRRTSVESELELESRVFSPLMYIYEFQLFLGDGHGPYHTDAIFYSGELISINLRRVHHSLEEILRQKYGSPKAKDSRRIATCSTEDGRLSRGTVGNLELTWGVDKKVGATYLENWYMCKRVFLSYSVKDWKKALETDKIKNLGLKQAKKDMAKQKAAESKF